MGQGISPQLLVSQVRATAAWALDDPSAGSYRDALATAEAIEATFTTDHLAYLRVLLAAHYVTVATFVPTDVDARIRHHLWWQLESEEQLLSALDLVDEAASWDPTIVSARVIEGVAGHHGEWLSVWAGALGRALAIGATAARDRAVERIDAELTREVAAFDRCLARREPLDILRAATVLAHNLGDLSRVVEAWPRWVKDEGLRERYMRLGHEGEQRHGGKFVLAGAINKPVMAPENDRFLAMRQARPLRKSRALLLPIGPFFDSWGELIAKSELLDDSERAEVLTALLETHVQRPAQQGCLRALAGFDRAFKGGLLALEDDVPSRLRKLLQKGPAVREHLGLDRARFEARMAKKLEPFVRVR